MVSIYPCLHVFSLYTATRLLSKLDVYLKNKLVRCYIWSIALCGTEKVTLRKVDEKHLEGFEMWYWRKMEEILWTNRVKSEVLRRVKEESNILKTIKIKEG